MKTIFITGASSGLGKATTKLFSAKGWNVIATMRTPAKRSSEAYPTSRSSNWMFPIRSKSMKWWKG
ncbi:SDR family NAD(P)-dependent oxidoreductase [Bradyrhizobium sp. AZCC 2289]|uniref:SDR family NAD(P)-dependent oxidoreductase n=1 Tax=Bradyrhizobium sp. AZCC 2289 TaxID=3117026 RepID=UPI003FA54A1F